jgi:hypothetical protein
MTTDAKVFAGCCVIAIFALGLEIGSEAKPVICPDKAPHEQLVSITINGPTTICTYAAPIYGRSLRKAKA